VHALEIIIQENVLCLQTFVSHGLLAACLKFQVQISGGSETQNIFPVLRNMHGIFNFKMSE